MALGKQYQPFVKSGAGVLVGVSQIRVGLPSVRALNTISGTATVKAIQQVPNSTISTVTGVDGSTSVDLVIAGDTLGASDVKTSTVVASGTYTGAYDGCFIIRNNGTTYDIFAPNGYKDAAVAVASITSGYEMKLASATLSGVTITGTVTTPASGTTFIVPVWSSAVLAKVQTGIISPYSPFLSDANSVGGLKNASWEPKLDDIKRLTSGFPAVEVDSMITKTSVGIKFTAQEFENANMAHLVNMIDAAINKSEVSSIPIEVVMRTKGGQLRTFWHPNCSLESLPTIAPTDDYSDFSWSFQAQKLTEVDGESVVFNTWLANANIYNFGKYIH